MSEALHPSATHHLPAFITPPGQSDVLMNVTIVFLVAVVLVVGNLYLRLHALPERMAHRANVVQFEVVAVLALLALFTHNNIFWVAALLLALVRIPDFSTPLASIANSLERLSVSSAPEARRREPDAKAEPKAEPGGATEPSPQPAAKPKPEQKPKGRPPGSQEGV
jgi:hypothetical protein